MQKKLIAILAATAVTALVTVVLLWSHLQRTRAVEQERARALQAEVQAKAEQERQLKQLEQDRARLERQNQELADLTQSLRATEANQSSNLATLARRLTATATNASGTTDDGAGAGAGISAMMEKMMKDPAMREMMRSQQKAMMSQMYGPLFQDLGLDATQREKFMEILLDTAMKGVEQAGSFFKPNTADKTEAMKVVSEQQKEMTASLKALLGDEKFAQYEEYQKTVGERVQLTQFQQQLAGTETPLQDSQMAQLMAILQEEKTRVPSVLSDDPNRSFEAMEAMKSEETMNRHFQWQEELNKRILERASSLLSDGQLKEYNGFLEQQLNMQRFGMRMAREMFGTGEATPVVQPEIRIQPVAK
jgi:hypothetical protein